MNEVEGTMSLTTTVKEKEDVARGTKGHSGVDGRWWWSGGEQWRNSSEAVIDRTARRRLRDEDNGLFDGQDIGRRRNHTRMKGKSHLFE